jgi:hypothetical protein
VKTAIKTKRERPADGGMEWHEGFNAFYCEGCDGWEEVRSHAAREPENLALLKELYILDHTECWEFDDPRMALDARRHRKGKKLWMILNGRVVAATKAPLDCSAYLRGRR